MVGEKPRAQGQTLGRFSAGLHTASGPSAGRRPEVGDQRRSRRTTMRVWTRGDSGQRLLAGALRFDALGLEVEQRHESKENRLLAETKLGRVGTTEH